MPDDYMEQMSGFEAHIGAIQSKKYVDIVSHRRALADLYFEALMQVEDTDFVLPPQNPGATYSHFAVRTPYAADLIKECRRKGIQLGDLIEYHCPDNGAFRQHRCVGPRQAAAWPGQMINLPLQRSVTEAEARWIADRLKECLAECRASR